MKYTFCIAHFNNSELLIRCIESIIKLPETFDYEVIVVDDFSRDDERQNVLALCSQYGVKVFLNKKNMGVTYSKNKAYRKSSGNWCIFIDCDDYFDTAKLAEFLFDLAAKLEYYVVFSHCIGFSNRQGGYSIGLKEYVSNATGEEALTAIRKKTSSPPPYYGQLRGYEGLGIMNILRKSNTRAYLSEVKCRFYTSDSTIQLSKGSGFYSRLKYLIRGHIIVLSRYRSKMYITRKLKLYALILYYSVRNALYTLNLHK